MKKVFLFQCTFLYIENKTTKIKLSPCVLFTFCTVTFRYLRMLTSYVTGGCCHISVRSECYASPLKGHWTSIASVFLYLILWKTLKHTNTKLTNLADSVNEFSFNVVFCEQHHPRGAPEATVLYIFEVDFEKIENARNIHISLKKKVEVEGNNQHTVITNINSSDGIKISFFVEKSGYDVILVQCPFKNSKIFLKCALYVHNKMELLTLGTVNLIMEPVLLQAP